MNKKFSKKSVMITGAVLSAGLLFGVAQSNTSHSVVHAASVTNVQSDAQTNFQNAQAQYNHQKQIVAHAQEQAGIANDAAATAKAKLDQANKDLKESKNPGSVDQAQKAINENQVKYDQKSQDAKNQHVTADNFSKKELADAQAKAASANKQTQDLQKQFDQAQKDATTAKDALNKSDAGKLVKNIDDALNTLNNDTQARDAASKQTSEYQKQYETGLVNQDALKQELQQNQAAYNQAKSENDQAQSDLATAKANYQQANTQYQQTYENSSEGLSYYQKIEAAIERGQKAAQKIILPAGYWDELYKMALANNFTNLTPRMKELCKEGMQTNLYHFDNDNREVDLNHITDEQYAELSGFVEGIINSARDQIGRPRVKYDLRVQQLAKKIAEYYNRDHFTINNPTHDVKAIVQAANELGLKIDGNYIEDEGQLLAGNKTTMGEIKSGLYWNLKQMLFGGAGSVDGPFTEMNHASDILKSTSTEMPMAFSISRLGNINSTHFITVDPDLGKVDPNYAGPRTQADLQNELKDFNTKKIAAKANVENLNNVFLAAQQTANSAKDSLNKAQNTLKQTQENITKNDALLASSQHNLSASTAKVISLNQKLEADRQAADDARTAAQNYAGKDKAKLDDYINKSKKVSDASDSLTQAKNDQISADENLAKVQAQYKVLQNNAKVADAAAQKANKDLEVAKQHLEDLKNAPEAQKKAQADYDAKKKAADDANAALATAQSQLQTAKANLDNAQAVLDGNSGSSNINSGDEIKISGVAFVPVINYNPNWKVALLDQDGHYTGKYISTNSSWKVFAKKMINGELYYRLGTENQWVPAKYANLNGASNSNTEKKISGVAHVPVIHNNRNWKVALLDSNGHYTGKYISTNSNWKVFASKTINGSEMVRLGSQLQWIPMQYVSWIR